MRDLLAERTKEFIRALIELQPLPIIAADSFLEGKGYITKRGPVFRREVGCVDYITR